MAEDLRGWLERVDKAGELEKIKGAHWDTEIGCLTTMNWRRKPSPALLFSDIPGYPPGYRVLTGSTRTPSRISMTFDLPTGIAGIPLLEAVRKKFTEWEGKLDRFPPKMVSSGPALENVLSGDRIDLLKFPVPKWHEEDGGRYIGTGDAVITRDPETGIVNAGTYRVMVQDRKTTGLYISPGRHGFLHLQKWHGQGKPAPVVVSVGHHPLVFRVACLEVPVAMEFNYMGAVRGEPMELLKEEVTGLPFPADSEIVIAGWCPPDKRLPEGPFGEWHGYYASKERPAPVIEVERIYHRNDPILMGSPPGRPPSDTSYFMILLSSAMLFNELTQAGIPDVKGVWFSEVGQQQFITVSIKQRYAGHARQAALIVSQLKRASYMNRYVVVVDDDIDPTNMDDVMWAIASRSNPETGIDIVRRTRSSSVDPTIRKPAEALFNSRAIIDACKPFEWINEFPKAIDFSQDVVNRLKAKYRTFA